MAIAPSRSAGAPVFRAIEEAAEEPRRPTARGIPHRSARSPRSPSGPLHRPPSGGPPPGTPGGTPAYGSARRSRSRGGSGLSAERDRRAKRLDLGGGRSLPEERLHPLNLGFSQRPDEPQPLGLREGRTPSPGRRHDRRRPRARSRPRPGLAAPERGHSAHRGSPSAASTRRASARSAKSGSVCTFLPFGLETFIDRDSRKPSSASRVRQIGPIHPALHSVDNLRRQQVRDPVRTCQENKKEPEQRR